MTGEGGKGYVWLPVIASFAIGWLWFYAATHQPQHLTLTATTSAAGITLTVPSGAVGPAQELVIEDEANREYLNVCGSAPCRVTVPATDTGTVVAKIVATNNATVYYRSSPVDLANVGGAG